MSALDCFYLDGPLSELTLSVVESGMEFCNLIAEDFFNGDFKVTVAKHVLCKHSLISQNQL